MISLDKPALHQMQPAKPLQTHAHVTAMQVYCALRKQTIKARPTICASFWRYRESGYCYINANGVTKRVSNDYFYHVQHNAESRYSFWNGAKMAGNSATVRKVFLIGFGV